MKMRDETVILACGCKVGRSGGGQWFFDYLCDEHVKMVRDKNGYNFEKASELTRTLNTLMKKGLRDLDKILKKQKRIDKTDSGINAVSTELHEK